MSGWLDRVWGTARACPANLERSGPSRPFAQRGRPRSFARRRDTFSQHSH